jgi:hypothetical protein
MQSMEETIVQLQEELKKAHKDIVYINKTLEMERDLYVNIRELLKSRDREINAMKEAYDMQIDLRQALEAKIDRLYGR